MLQLFIWHPDVFLTKVIRNCGVFDFDDSIYGWYALDIAIAAVHAVWWGSPGKTGSPRIILLLTF